MSEDDETFDVREEFSRLVDLAILLDGWMKHGVPISENEIQSVFIAHSALQSFLYQVTQVTDLINFGETRH